MTVITSKSTQGRRQFLSSLLPICSLTLTNTHNKRIIGHTFHGLSENVPKHKFQKDWTMTYEQTFRYRYKYYINLMHRFAEFLGRDRLIKMIQKATDEYILADSSDGSDFNFTDWIKKGDEYFKNMMAWEVIEQTPTSYEMRVSECLWSKIFQEYNAADIGYATVFYSDFASAKATHPGLSLERTKTIMEGHRFCNHRWILEV